MLHLYVSLCLALIDTLFGSKVQIFAQQAPDFPLVSRHFYTILLISEALLSVFFVCCPGYADRPSPLTSTQVTLDIRPVSTAPVGHSLILVPHSYTFLWLIHLPLCRSRILFQILLVFTPLTTRAESYIIYWSLMHSINRSARPTLIQTRTTHMAAKTNKV
jgi:hypothetical protein